MCKRILLLLLTVILLMYTLPVQAEEEDIFDRIDNALYRIVLRTAQGDVTLGSGVLFMDPSVILTAESCCADGQLFAVGRDGEHAIQAMEKAGQSGAVLMEMATRSAADPLTLANHDVDALYSVFGADSQGNTGTVPLYQMVHGVYRGQASLVLSAEEGLLPGAFVADEKGKVVALVVAQQAEGLGMYAALDSDTLYNAMTDKPYLPLTCSWYNGWLNVTWQDEARSEGKYMITLIGATNGYYTTFEQACSEDSISLMVPPGHTYYLQVYYAASGKADLPVDWSCVFSYTLPETPMTWYGFTQECYLASAPAEQEVTEVLPEMTGITSENLMSEDTARYLQVINRYDVARELQYPLSLELLAPDGQFFFSDHMYIFVPEYEENDSFAMPVDELFTTCAEFSGGKLPAGEYRLRYAIAGKIAGEYTFMVE